MLYKDTPLELEENENDFNETCNKLKQHPFFSPWKMFFKPPADEFNTEVSEFVIEDQMETESNLSPHLDKNVLPTFSHDVPKNDATCTAVPFDELKVSRLKESLMNVQDNSTIEHIKDFDIFFTVASSEIPSVFRTIDLTVLSEPAVILLLTAFLEFKDKISMATVAGLVSHLICPVMFESKKNNPRSVLELILKFSEFYPKAVVDEMMLPYLNNEASDGNQLEDFIQMCKIHIPSDYVGYSIKSILEHAPPEECSFSILQSLIERKVLLESVLFDMLLKKLLNWTPAFNKNLKFTKLLTSILTAYGSELNFQQLEICEEVIKTNKTIIKKAAENLLKKIKEEQLPS